MLRSRGATVTVAAYGEVLFVEGQDIPRWTKRFSRKITQFASAAAPAHGQGGQWPGQRTLRPHDRGMTLKKSFTSTTEPDAIRMRVDAAVGNRAPYSTFVDQGTGIYNPEGGTPYQAKVLPPWKQGEGSLYEATWTPGKNQVAPVMIKGQKGQQFMQAGLDRAFTFMMKRAQQVTAEPQAARAMAFFPENLALRGTGNTPNDAAFRASMDEWRSWRDEAFWRGDLLGRGQTRGRSRAGYEKGKKLTVKARADLATSRAFSNQRETEQRESLNDIERRKKEGEERRARASQASRERQARAAAVKFRNAQTKVGSTITAGGWVPDEDGRYIGFRVTYVNVEGETLTKLFPV